MRRVLITISGSTLIGVGLLLLVLPGPGLLLIFAGLLVLGGEYVWARRLTERVKEFVRRQQAKRRNRPNATDQTEG
ncbi:MAG TPA: PGPGW domain-containing protein [candidate division Zixibacteria bacterium]|nr:PGPGW domain-containing protein [candidate division Zixibacteria bacterium]